MAQGAIELERAAPALTLGEETRRRGDRVWRRFARSPLPVLALLSLLGFSAIAASAPLFISYDRVTQQSLRSTFQPPNPTAWFGRDELGRDAFARSVYGGRISLFVALISAVLSTVIAVLLGVLAGYLGGWVDAVI